MSLKNIHVLIIDDAPDIRLLVRKILENMEMIVAEADSVDAAMTCLTQNVPHLILCDISMPRKNGFAFLHALKAYVPAAGTPVIMLTGQSDKNSVHQALDLGVCDYVIKPFTAAALLQRVRKALKDQDFNHYVFPENARPTGYFSLQGSVTKINPTGFLLESPVKIAGKTALKIRSEEFSDYGMDQCLFQSHLKASIKGASDFYITRVNAVGLNESIIKMIQKKERGKVP